MPRVHLEDVSVTVGEVLLAGEPGSPRCRPASTVVARARGGDEVPDLRTILQVHQDAGGSPRLVGVVRVGAHYRGPVLRLQLVVAYQDRGVLAWPSESGHAVVVAGDGASAGQRCALFGDHAVLETLRQI